MAYVVWRVLRKKYLKVRSGVTLNGLMVCIHSLYVHIYINIYTFCTYSNYISFSPVILGEFDHLDIGIFTRGDFPRECDEFLSLKCFITTIIISIIQ